MAEHTNFRQQLDEVLRTLDVKQVQSFLIAQNQWSEDVPENPELAMWMMVAGSPTLRNLHERARNWLIAHGHEGEAEALLGRGGKSASSSQRPQGKAKQRPSGGEKRKPRVK